MNDGIMYVWNVIGDYSGVTLHSCVKKETAEYLRDWCDAISEQNNRQLFSNLGRSYDLSDLVSVPSFSIEEGEVIL